MMRLTDLILVEHNALTDGQCDHLVELIQLNETNSINEECFHAVTGKLTQSTMDVLYLTPENPDFEMVHQAKSKAVKSYLDMIESSQHYHAPILKDLLKFFHHHRLMKYDVGGWIHPHTDWNYAIHASITIALNDESEYEGGDFSFWNGEHKLRLKKGDALIFPADPYWVHEVTEITQGTRYSTNSFICCWHLWCDDSSLRSARLSVWK
jgi:hypothetical protein